VTIIVKVRERERERERERGDLEGGHEMWNNEGLPQHI
jgi:hypothetical protein